MKRLAAILLLVLMLFYSLGYIGIYKLSRFHIKQEMKVFIKKYIPNQQLLCFTVSKSNASQFNWYEHGKEFRYKGKMYDVVRSEINDNSISYYCIADEKETALMATIDKYFSENFASRSTQNSKAANLMKQFVQSFFTTKQACIITCPEFNSKSAFNFNNEIAIVIIDIPSPPPKQSITL